MKGRGEMCSQRKYIQYVYMYIIVFGPSYTNIPFKREQSTTSGWDIKLGIHEAILQRLLYGASQTVEKRKMMYVLKLRTPLHKVYCRNNLERFNENPCDATFQGEKIARPKALVVRFSNPHLPICWHDHRRPVWPTMDSRSDKAGV